MFFGIFWRTIIYFMSFLFVSMLSIFFTLCVLNDIFFYRKEGVKNSSNLIIIKNGSSLTKIINTLDDNGFVYNSKVFSIFLRLFSINKQIQSGEYRITKNTKAWHLLSKMFEGDTVNHSFAIAPGTSACQILEKLSKEKLLTESKNLKLADGELLADTYLFKRGESKEAFLKRIKLKSSKIFTELWKKRSENLQYSNLKNAITLASILEKEALKKEDFFLISGSINERMKRKMKLQLDSTVIYAMTRGCKPLKRKLIIQDLALKSKYNTYYINGLPPNPISTPSLLSLNAALHPVQNNKIFFIMNNSGSYIFSSTHKEHVFHKKMIRINTKKYHWHKK